MWEPDRAEISSIAASVPSMLYLLALTEDSTFSYLIKKNTVFSKSNTHLQSFVWGLLLSSGCG